jgi:hypothetical protein
MIIHRGVLPLLFCLVISTAGASIRSFVKEDNDVSIAALRGKVSLTLIEWTSR